MSGATNTTNAAGDFNWQQLGQALVQQQHFFVMPPGGIHQSAAIPYDNRANFRALLLLWRHLTPAQRAQYRLFCQGIDHEGRSFIVTGNRSGDHFRIFETGSVLRLRDQHRFCLVLTGEPVPPADMMLAKKLLLEHDEQLFLATANDLTEPHALAEQMRIAMELERRQLQEIRRRSHRNIYQRIRQW